MPVIPVETAWEASACQIWRPGLQPAAERLTRVSQRQQSSVAREFLIVPPTEAQPLPAVWSEKGASSVSRRDEPAGSNCAP